MCSKNRGGTPIPEQQINISCFFKLYLIAKKSSARQLSNQYVSGAPQFQLVHILLLYPPSPPPNKNVKREQLRSF